MERSKSNATMKTVRKQKVNKMDRKRGVLADLEIRRGAGSDRMENIMRLVSFRPDDRQIYRCLTNRFDLSPFTIANLYRAPWAIEKPFKWLFSNLDGWISHRHNKTPDTTLTLIVGLPVQGSPPSGRPRQ